VIVETFVQTPFQQNTRIAACERTRKAICIDPGEASEEVAGFVKDNGLELMAICITHGHLDHCGGTAFMKERFPEADVLVHRAEEPLYYSLPKQPLLMGFEPHQLAAFGMEYGDPPKATKNPEDREVLEIGELGFEVRHCPGHTPGHVVLVEHNERTVFTGDCLFSGTIGRTDLPGGSYEQLIASIRSNVLSLDDDFTVLCGHGPDTTVGRERASNPFLTGVYGG